MMPLGAFDKARSMTINENALRNLCERLCQDVRPSSARRPRSRSNRSFGVCRRSAVAKMGEVVDAGSAETEEFCRDVRLQSTLAMGEKPMVTIVAEWLTQWLTQWSARQRVSVSEELAMTYLPLPPPPRSGFSAYRCSPNGCCLSGGRALAPGA